MSRRKSRTVVNSPPRPACVGADDSNAIVAASNESPATIRNAADSLRLAADSGDRRATYLYDWQARLTAIILPNGVTETFLYGRRPTLRPDQRRSPLTSHRGQTSVNKRTHSVLGRGVWRDLHLTVHQMYLSEYAFTHCGITACARNDETRPG